MSKVSPVLNPALNVMILSLEYSPKVSGGVGTHVLELSRGLSRAGHHATVAAFTPGRATTLSEGNLRVHMVPPKPRMLERRSVVRTILDFNQDLLSYVSNLLADPAHRPDLINYHNWTTWPAARELGRNFGIPVLGTIHFLSEPTERWWGQTPDPEIVEQEKALFAEADRFIIVSQSMREIVEATHNVDSSGISVVYNGLDLAPFMDPPLSVEAATDLRRTIASDEEKIVLFAGRLTPQKGISALVASAARVVNQVPNVVYILLGEPDTREMVPMIDGLFAQYPELQNRVKLLGKVPRNQLATLCQIADLVVIPSVYDTCPYMAVEAMAAGLPVVATRVGGLAEMIVHGETGLLVPVDQTRPERHEIDVDQLAAAQVTLLSDRALARRMAKAGQQRAATKYTLEEMVQQTIQVYRQVCATQALSTIH